MSTLGERIENEIVSRRLLPDSSTVVIAVSGGIDSMVLLALLNDLAPRHAWKLVVAHFDHRLRGEESDQDSIFVQSTAEKLGLKSFAGMGDVRACADESGQSIEMAARQLRHQFLAQAAREANASRIALAHHANDQAEIFLLRLLRGVIGEGLGGMKWQNPSSADSSILLVRPLLGTCKEEIEQFAADQKIQFRRDASNDDFEFARNRVRHELLPLLRNIHPQVDTFLLRTAECIGEQNEALRTLAREWLRSSHADLSSEPVALQQAVIHEQLLSLQIASTFQLIDDLRVNPGKEIMISPGRVIWRKPNGSLATKHVVVPVFCADRVQIQVIGSDSIVFSGLTISWELVDDPTIEANRSAEIFDRERVGNSITLRYWQPGDRFQPIGFPLPAKLQDLFTSAKVESAEKRKRVVAATSEGVIFWVEGLRIGELFKVTASSRKLLRWSWGEGIANGLVCRDRTKLGHLDP